MAYIEHREMDDGVLQAPYDPHVAIRGMVVLNGNLVLDCYDEAEYSWQETIVMSEDELRNLRNMMSAHLGDDKFDEEGFRVDE